MEKRILNYIKDMNDFIGNKHWPAFQAGTAERGFTNEQVDELSEELGEFLFNTDQQLK
jgi:hypothetical protein